MSLIEGYRKDVRTITVTDQTFLKRILRPFGHKTLRIQGFGSIEPRLLVCPAFPRDLGLILPRTGALPSEARPLAAVKG
jgi:hypothetical protein